MDKKPKKCKGTGKAKGSGCGDLKWIKRFGLCEPCYISWLLKDKRGKEYKKRITIKAQAPHKKMREGLKQMREEKKKRATLSSLLTSTKNAVHRFVRIRDKGKPCISCNSLWHSDFQAGHYYKAELYSTLRFNFDNIHAQCPKCNIYLEGNLNQYAINLEKKIGKNKFIELKNCAMKDKQEGFKWDREELKKIRIEAHRRYYKEVNKR